MEGDPVGQVKEMAGRHIAAAVLPMLVSYHLKMFAYNFPMSWGGDSTAEKWPGPC